jgi:uncharacterized protein (DUF1684 family)
MTAVSDDARSDREDRCMAPESPSLDARPDDVADLEAWHEARHAFVTSPLGNLALVETVWGRPGDPTVPDEDALRGQADGAVLTRLSRASIDTGETELGHRIWRRDSPANTAFERIDAYAYDPSWVLDATFEHVDDDRTIPFEHIRDAGASRALPVSGDLVFSRDGVEHRMSAFDTAGRLQLVFGDPTNGSETYGAGRFLYVDLPAADAPRTAGAVIPVRVDFNRAFVPPCGFSSAMNCPLPPRQNRFAVPVRAGEKQVVFRDGFTL